MSYPWSGNVRELEHTISRAIILTAVKGLIRLKDLKLPGITLDRMLNERDLSLGIQYSLSGFQITSRGLPGLRDFMIEPDLVPPSEKSEITNDQMQAVEDKVAFKGKTISPTG